MLLSMLILTASLSQDPAGAGAVTSTEVASPASAEASISLGLQAFKKRRFGQAEIEFRRAMEVDPSSPAAAFYLAYTYYKVAERKRPFHPEKQKAAEMFARAYELDPSFKPAWSK